MIYRILTIPDKKLRRKAEPVKEITDEIRKLAEDMAETMYAAPGVGLAAPQIGANLRIVTIDVAEEGQPAQLLTLINPEILEKRGQTSMEEGCLSVPNYFEEIPRAEFVRLRYTDLEGVTHEIEAEGMLAIAAQHETDYLDGKMFIDYLSSLKRVSAQRRVNQWNKEHSYAGTDYVER